MRRNKKGIKLDARYPHQHMSIKACDNRNDSTLI